MSGTEAAPLARFIARAAGALAVLALLALSWRYMDLLGDSFWSVATGRYILEHRALPSSDPFSFTANRPWIVHMPLSQVLFGWVADHFGVLALELFGTLVLTAALLCLWWPHARGALARYALWPCLLLLIVAQSEDLCVRGQIFGDLAFALLLVCGFRLRDGKRVSPLIGVLLGSAWINLHSSAFLAPAVPLSWALLSLLGPGADRARARSLSVFGAAAAVGLLLNPYGPKLVADLWRLFRLASTRNIDLFLPPDFGSPWTWLPFAVALAAAVACWRGATPQLGRAEALLLLGFMLAAASGRRYLPLMLAFAIVVLGRVASARWPGPAPRLAAPLFALGSALTALWGLSVDKDPWQNVPLEEAKLVELLKLPDRIANPYHWGGYLDYAWYGRRKVFIDGRNQLFEGGALAAHQKLEQLDGWQQVLDSYRINTVLWEKGAPLDAALATSPAWLSVRRGRLAVLYVRREPLALR